jgi:hypothetical protein
MRTIITLSGQGGELDRVVVGANEVTPERLQAAMLKCVAGWVLSAGDTITITEEESPRRGRVLTIR